MERMLLPPFTTEMMDYILVARPMLAMKPLPQIDEPSEEDLRKWEVIEGCGETRRPVR